METTKNTIAKKSNTTTKKAAAKKPAARKTPVKPETKVEEVVVVEAPKAEDKPKATPKPKMNAHTKNLIYFLHKWNYYNSNETKFKNKNTQKWKNSIKTLLNEHKSEIQPEMLVKKLSIKTDGLDYKLIINKINKLNK